PDIKPQPSYLFDNSSTSCQTGGVHIKTMENEILREAVEYGRAKNVWSAPVLQANTGTTTQFA
ncbi:hypothetical protein, partial [Ralstonia pseudosolanacearum]|uniref:hypothetical protein n=1 Tax=Ralstonia pseudosolanacearum TaxID=1310165 RepID=UPI003CF77C8D